MTNLLRLHNPLSDNPTLPTITALARHFSGASQSQVYSYGEMKNALNRPTEAHTITNQFVSSKGRVLYTPPYALHRSAARRVTRRYL